MYRIVYNYDLLSGSEEHIHKRIEDICISMKAQDYLEMPFRTDNYIKLTLPKNILDKYNEFEKEKVLELFSANEEAVEINAVNAAAMSNKLLQFANGAVYDEDRNVHNVHDIKLEALKEIIENDKNVLLYGFGSKLKLIY